MELGVDPYNSLNKNALSLYDGQDINGKVNILCHTVPHLTFHL